MGISCPRLLLLLVIGSLLGASSAFADQPVWDPAGSAQGLAATAQNAAGNASAFTETTMATNCVTDATGPVAPTPPPDDPFYKPPAKIPAGAPGKVIRTRPTCIGEAHIPVPYRA